MDTDDEIIAELAAFDRLMDLLSFGLWSWIHGRQKAGYRSKVEVE